MFIEYSRGGLLINIFYINLYKLENAIYIKLEDNVIKLID